MQDTSTSRGPMRRAFLGIPLIFWAAISTATVALAVIGYVVVLGMTGTITTGEGINVSFVPGSVSASSNMPGSIPVADWSCDATATTDDLALDVTGMIGNTHCYIEVNVVNNGVEPAALQRFDTALNSDGLAGIGTTLVNTVGGNFCQASIPADGIPVTVGFQFDFYADGAVGYSYTFDGSWEGLQFVRADMYNSLECG